MNTRPMTQADIEDMLGYARGALDDKPIHKIEYANSPFFKFITSQTTCVLCNDPSGEEPLCKACWEKNP